MESNSEVSHEPASPERNEFTIGAMSLVFFVVAAIVFGVTFAGAGNGVDAGHGLAAAFIRFCFPMVIVAGIMSVIAVTRNKGRVPGAITLAATTGHPAQHLGLPEYAGVLGIRFADRVLRLNRHQMRKGISMTSSFPGQEPT